MNNWQWSLAIFLNGVVFFLLYRWSVNWNTYLIQETFVLNNSLNLKEDDLKWKTEFIKDLIKKFDLKFKEEFTTVFPTMSQWFDISKTFIRNGKIDGRYGSHVVVLLAAVAATNGNEMSHVYAERVQ